MILIKDALSHSTLRSMSLNLYLHFKNIQQKQTSYHWSNSLVTKVTELLS